MIRGSKKICDGVGDNTGVDVGDNIGDDVGDGVGDNVGDDVGDNVGDDVGLRRIAPLGFRKKSIEATINIHRSLNGLLYLTST